MIGPRVALVFWGMTRALNYTIGSIEKHIFLPLEAANVTWDVYMHTYRMRGNYSNTRNGVLNIQLNYTEYQLLKPTVYRIDSQDRVDAWLHWRDYSHKGDPWDNDFLSLRNSLRALYSQMVATLLVAASGKHYNAVVLLRPDVLFLNDLNATLLTHVQANTAYLPDFGQYGGLNDRFAFGTPDAMYIYGTRYMHALQYSTSHQLHSESYVRDYLQYSKLSAVEVPIRFLRFRATGKADPQDAPFVPIVPAPANNTLNNTINNTVNSSNFSRQ
jgi:hypothetical protein